MTPFLAAAGLVAEPPTAEQRSILEAIAPMAQERMIVLSEAVGLLRFLFVDEIEIEPAAAEKQLVRTGRGRGARRRDGGPAGRWPTGRLRPSRRR